MIRIEKYFARWLNGLSRFRMPLGLTLRRGYRKPNVVTCFRFLALGWSSGG